MSAMLRRMNLQARTRAQDGRRCLSLRVVRNNFLMVFLITVLVVQELQATPQAYKFDYVGDDSDWWTIDHMLNSLHGSVKIQVREPDAANFRIAGAELGEDEFDTAASKFGKTPIVERGARSGHLRRQACYVAVQNTGNVYLVFEKSWLDFTAYLFADGPDWDGRRLCAVLKNTSLPLTTGSGLHIGESPAEVVSHPWTTELSRQELLILFPFPRRKKA